MKKALFTLFLFSQSWLAADEVLPPSPEKGFLQTVIMFGIAGVFFYFMLFRPEQKRRKALEAIRSQVKKGDRVTAMGIIGTVAKVQDQTVVVRMYDGSKIEFVKAAISEVLPGNEEEIQVEQDK